MRVIKDQTIENDVLDLDDTYLLNCKVKNCEIVYTGKHYAYKGTTFENCRLMLLGAAKWTQLFLGEFGQLKEEETPPEAKSESSDTVH